jgi:SM-20-related protein
LQEIFDVLINSFIETKIGIANNFLSKQLGADLVNNLNSLYENKHMQAAGIGNDSVAVQNKLVRSDVIYWLDREHNDQYENAFFDLIDSFVLYLNNSCYTGITGYEFHYALYETGSFYKKHLDQFKNNESRQFSMIIYLNENWVDGDGGQLSIHHEGEEYRIDPTGGKSVFFKSSELAHEVLMTNKPRMSITGWLKR